MNPKLILVINALPKLIFTLHYRRAAKDDLNQSSPRAILLVFKVYTWVKQGTVWGVV
jgi:hypothetical protein